MSKFPLVAAPAAAATLAVGSLLASIGAYARPAGDDFCTAVTSRAVTPLGVGWFWFMHINGRTLNGVVAGALLTSPVASSTIAPPLWIVGMIAALYLAVRRCAPQLPAVPVAVAAALTTIAAFLVTATPYDSLFWLSAAISHVLPIILGLVAIAWVVARPRGHLWVPVLLGLATGQTNEAIGLLLAITVLQVVFGLRRFGGRDVPLPAAIALATGALAGSALTVLSPGSFERRRVVADVMKPIGLRTMIVGPLEQSASVLTHLALHPATGAVALIGVCLGLATTARTLPTRPLAVLAPAVLALEWTLGVLVALTIGYRTPLAAPRAYIAITVAVLIAVAWYGALFGNRLASRRVLAGACASVLAAVALAAHTPAVLGLRRDAHAIAVAWDAQQRQISALPAGTRTATIRRLPIGRTPQPSYASGKWVLNCMRTYHRLPGLRVEA